MKFKIIKITKLRGGEPKFVLLLEGKMLGMSADSGSSIVYEGEFKE